MLQISTGKFFESSNVHETLYRGVYYTNYRIFDRAKIETPVGILLPSTAGAGLSTLTYEVVERIEGYPGGPFPGEIVSTGGDMVVNDFAAIISFALNITCASQFDLTSRLITPGGPSLGNIHVPQKFIPRVFDTSVQFARGDDERLSSFIKRLIALDRKHYEGAMRAIRRYVTGARRIADDVNLAYALFVMAIESLAQEFDGHVAEWSDYDQPKRIRIDAALSGATDDTSENVRQAILQNEHVAIARRFRSFALAHVDPSYFRSEAADVQGAISRPDLDTALRQAYEIRSGYVHRLKEINTALVSLPGFTDAIELDGRATLTFAGLSRLARHVITQFIGRSPKVEREPFDYRSAFPNIVKLPLTAQHWIDKPDAFTAENSSLFVTAFLGQIADLFLTKGAQYSDLRPVLTKIETLLPGLSRPAQRMPLLTLYRLFHLIAPKELHQPQWPTIVEKYDGDFRTPSIESLMVHLIGQQPPPWNVEQLEELYRKYFRQRQSSKTTKIGRFFEAAFTLHLAEAYRDSDPGRAREVVALAVECMPRHAGLKAFEGSIFEEPVPPINWVAILVPSPAPIAE
jgi:hypothetical protein